MTEWCGLTEYKNYDPDGRVFNGFGYEYTAIYDGSRNDEDAAFALLATKDV